MILLKHWEHVSLGSVCTKIGSGATPRGGENVYVENGPAIIRSQNIYNGKFEYSGLAHLTEEHADQLKGVTVQSRDVLLNITGDSVARCCQVPEAVLPSRVNQHVAIIRPDPEDLLPEFLCYYLISPQMQKYLLSLAGSGGTRNALTKGMIEAFEVPRPPIHTQLAIVTILSAYDDLIENNRRRIQLLEESARLLYKEWFVHLRFPGHEHVKIINGIPEGWERQKLTDLAESVSYGLTATASQEEIGPKFLRITDIVPSSIDWDAVPHCRADEKKVRANLLEIGDVVVARTGATVGYSKRLSWFPSDVVFASYLVRFRFAPMAISLLAGVYMESEAYKDFVRNHAGGAAQPNANAKVLASASILVPPKELLDRFEEVVTPVFNLRDTLLRQISRLAKTRDLLLPRLMNGEVSV